MGVIQGSRAQTSLVLPTVQKNRYLFSAVLVLLHYVPGVFP